MMENEIMVTVKMLAYNHGKYIVQAIESILAQKTKYKYELLIGEDCSTDGTREIIKQYEEKYPDVIRVLYHDKNLGCTMNSYLLDLAAKGEFIAGCEGDDFWCDENRIQKDVDFLKSHSEFVGICHRCCVVDENGKAIDTSTLNNRIKFWEFDKEYFTIKDFEEWRTPGHGCAMTSRNVIKDNKLDYSIVYKASQRVGDRTHLLINVVEGDIFCVQDVVACYRYISSEEHNNFMSVQKKKNLRDEDYLMMVRLEQWALDNKGLKLDLNKVKKDRLAGAVATWMKNKTQDNRRVVLDIIEYSGQRVLYSIYVFAIIVIKMYYWKVKKIDKIIDF